MTPCLRGSDRPFRKGRLFWHSALKPWRQVVTALRLRFTVMTCVIASLLLCSGQGSAELLDENGSWRHDAVLVLDNSASMKKVDPDLLLREVGKRFVAATEEGARVGVVVFDERVRLLAPLTFLDRASRPQLSAMLDNLDYHGALSDLPGAIERAVYELRSRGRRDVGKSVLLITDGIVDLGSRTQLQKATGWLTDELAAQAAAEGIGIFGIALSEKADYRLFQSLAYITDADYFRARNVEEVAPILDQLNQRLRHAAPAEPDDTVAAPTTPTPPPGMRETAVEYLPATASVAPPDPFADELRMILPFGESSVSPLAMGAAGMPKHWFREPGGATSVTLLVILMLVVWVLWQLARGRQWRTAVADPAPSPRDAVPRAFLYDLSGATDSELHDVSKKLTVIGRLGSASKPEASCSPLLINDPTISRRHAIIEYRQQGFWLIDQRSRNGTYIGGERVLEPMCLKHNDRITLSKIDFEFHIAAMDEAAETVFMRA